MARALIAGLLRQGSPPQQLRVGEPEAAARAALEREFAVVATADNAAAIDGAEAGRAGRQAARWRRRYCGACAPHWPGSSPGAAVDRRRRADRRSGAAVPARLPIVRAMPNRPALVGAGVTGAVRRTDRAGRTAAAGRARRRGRRPLRVAARGERARHRHRAVGQRTGVFLSAGRTAGAGRNRARAGARDRDAAGDGDAAWQRRCWRTAAAPVWPSSARRLPRRGGTTRGGAGVSRKPADSKH